ncbi:hypothetical protein [uncultured Parolsenella sp.]|uniref:hypothetical protein n=1 Tax=uncultured Parolsenella sp. TaxID=2083008 RepID=UPI0027D97770|nr:hypothetical protein [uncultured Parolsenella sp.]
MENEAEVTEQHVTPEEMQRHLDIEAKGGIGELEAYLDLMEVLGVRFKWAKED